MKLSSIQQFGFAVLVFGLGCASSLWLESSSAPSNPFFQDGASLAGPVSFPSRPSTIDVETRTPREEIEARRLLEAKPQE